MEEINILDFLNYVKKYIVIIMVLSFILLVEVVVYDKAIKVPMYKTYTTIVLTQASDASNSTITQNDITINQKLVSTYSEIIKSKLILEQVISGLNLDYSYGDLKKNVSVEALTNTEILKISVEDANADKAAEIANKIATVFSKEVTKIYQLNNISILDKAQVPKTVSNNTLKRDMAISVFIGIFLSVAVIFVIYYFDDSIKLSDNLEEEVGLPVVAKVFKSNIKNKTKGKKEELLLVKYPKSLVSESIKTLRTNLQFSSVDNEVKTILVTSSIPGEGKSFISSNLAIAFTQTGKNVLIVDCDMRKGRQHKIFKASNSKGLSNLLIDDITKFDRYVNRTIIENLSLITRGAVPPNPSELLNSNKNKLLINLLKEKYDIIIFDGVPCNGLPDSIIMSNLVDQVLIVSSDSVTPKSTFENTKKTLEKVDAPIAGIVLNNIDRKNNSYGKYYSYYEDINK